MRIKTLTIQNFKAFGLEERFEFDGKNILIYGNNGAGKSSIYYALHAFMQSSATGKNWEKYFDPGKDENLLNRYVSPTDYPPFIRVELSSTSSLSYELNPDPNVRTGRPTDETNDSYIRLANLASDFMNYRLLANFYYFRNSESANIWPVFEQEILPYWQLDPTTDNTPTFEDELKAIREELYRLKFRRGPIRRSGRMGREYKALLARVDQYNSRFADEFRRLLPAIRPLLTEFLDADDRFEPQLQPVRILEIHDEDPYGWKEPAIYLTLTSQSTRTPDIPKPQSFLNEARLTALALAIRLAMVGQKFKSIESRDDLKILVLDDLLISLDMSNRMKVIKYLQTNEDFKNYQLIILTHDKGLFEVLKTTLAKTWKWFELFDNGDSNSGRNPICIESDDALARAKFFLEDNTLRDYDVCALYLRRKAEELLRLLYDPSIEELTRFHQQKTLYKSLEGIKTELDGQASWRLQRVLNTKRLSDIQIDWAFDGGINPSSLPPAQRREAGEAIALRVELKKMLKTHYQNREPIQRAKEELIAICERVNEIRRRILNSGAHYNHEPLFEAELRTALDQLIQLKEATFRYISDLNNE